MKPATHDENRSKVCILCLKKNNLRNISENTKKVITARRLLDLDTKGWYYPTKICSRCSFVVLEDLDVFAYKYNMKMETRSEKVCECEICLAARVTLLNSEHIARGSKKRGRPTTSAVSKKARTTVTICCLCYTEIAKGKRHACTKVERHSNLLNIVKGDHSKSGESVVGAYMRDKVSNDDGSVKLSNLRGRPSHWTKGAPIQKKTPFLSIDDLFLIKNSCDLSTRNTLKLSSTLRGLDIEIAPNLKMGLTKLNQRLAGFFQTTHLPFDVGADISKGQPYICLKPVVYCNDVTGLIEYMLKERSIPSKDYVFFKIGIDGGGGSLKITLSIVEKPANESRANEEVRKMKSTGVKKLLLLAIIPGIPEKYDNISQVWSTLLELNKLDAVVAGDLKMVNLLVGVMGHSSSYPCPYCSTPKVSLSTKSILPRTLGIIRENYLQWKRDGSNDKLAKNYSNCVREPLLHGSSDAKIVLLCPPPSLHITLGIINAIYKKVQSIDPEVAERWVVQSNSQRHSKYGFTGRNCHKLLMNRSMLSSNGPLSSLRMLLDQFQDVYESCFKEELAPDYRFKVEKFSESWVKSELPNSSKFHILRFHVPEFCGVSKSGLGKYSEQASETVHFDYAMTWAKVKVPESSEKYDDALLHSVVLYNSAHI